MASAREHFLARQHRAVMSARAELSGLREQENRADRRRPRDHGDGGDASPRPAHLLKRGAYDAPGDVVPRDTPASLPPFPKDQPRNRLGLARWLTDRGNPLAARVVVNRIWRMHFGRGLVATQEDFGSQGKLPSHPELLDWLAAQLHGQRLGREGAPQARSSRPTRFGSRRIGARPSAAPRPGQRAARARAEAASDRPKQIRDSALAASGLLDRTIGGPSVKPYQPAGPLGAVRHRQNLQAGHGRQALSPQPLHVLAAHVAAAIDGHLRRGVARSLHGEARRHRHAAPVAGAAQRSAVRRGRARARASAC